MKAVRLVYFLARKAIPLQAWTGPAGSRRWSLPEFIQSAHKGVKVISLAIRPPFTQLEAEWTSAP
jgi:hypothetical protein